MENIEKKLFHKIKFGLLFMLILLIITAGKVNADMVGYVFSYHGEFYEINFESLKILRETKTDMILLDGEHIVYDKDKEKCFVDTYDELIAFDVDKFLIEKRIKPPQSYGLGGKIFLNPGKNQIYLSSKNESKEQITLIYKSSDYSSTEIIEQMFRYYQFTSDGEYLFRIWGEDNNGKIIIEKRDTNNFGLIKTFYLPALPVIDYVESFILSTDSRRLYVKGRLRQGAKSPNYLLVLDADTGALIQDLIIGVFPVILSNDCKYLYTLRRNDYPDGTLFVVRIDANTFSREEILVGKVGGAVLSLSPDGSILAIGTGTDRTDGQITVVDLIGKKTKGELTIEYGVAAIYFK